MEKSGKKLEKKWSEIQPWIVAALTLITGNLATNVIWDICTGNQSGTLFPDKERWLSGVPVTKGLWIVLFVLLVIRLFQLQNTFFRPRTRYLKNVDEVEKRSHLILFLSNLPERAILDQKYNNGVPEKLESLLTGDFDSDIDIAMVQFKNEQKTFWSWEMPCRAIRHHLPRLEKVYILCSKESLEQLKWFTGFLDRYASLNEVRFFTLVKPERSKPKVVSCRESCAGSGWDYEDFDALSEIMWFLLQDLKKKKVPENEIMVDFTGGQKVTSVVAATMTFNQKTRAQYVQTGSPHDVKSYDVIHATGETKGLGLG